MRLISGKIFLAEGLDLWILSKLECWKQGLRKRLYSNQKIESLGL